MVKLKPSWDTFLNGKSCVFCFFLTGSEHVMVNERITTWYFYIFSLKPSSEPWSFGWVGKYHHRLPPSVWVTLGPISMENIFFNTKFERFSSNHQLTLIIFAVFFWGIFLGFLLRDFFGMYLNTKNSEGYCCFWGQPYRQPPNRTTSSYLLGGILFDSKSWTRYFCCAQKVLGKIHGKLQHFSKQIGCFEPVFATSQHRRRG